MKMQSKFIIRKALRFLFEGKERGNICYYSNCKQQEKTNGCLHSLFETTQADTFTAAVQGTEPIYPPSRFFDSCCFYPKICRIVSLLSYLTVRLTTVMKYSPGHQKSKPKINSKCSPSFLFSVDSIIVSYSTLQ